MILYYYKHRVIKCFTKKKKFMGNDYIFIILLYRLFTL